MPVIDKSLVKRGMFIQGGACPAITKHHAPEPSAVGAKLPPAATLPVVYGQSLTSPDAVAARLRASVEQRRAKAAPPPSTELTSPDAVAARLRERAARLREQAEVLKQARREQREREQQECEAWLDKMGL